MADKFYITTPLYYVNASPHIGHSYTNIAADCLARFMRVSIGKENVWFLTGTDEHGQKIQRAAQAAGLTPAEFTDSMVNKFVSLWKKLDISYDDFIRTTESRHIECVQRVLEILNKKGDIYDDEYEGWYCTPCETFWVESQLNGQEACLDCGRGLEKVLEKNYFFRLSKYQPWLISYIESHPDFIRPKIRHNEVLSFLKLNKLNDLCVSRPKERLNWGISLPFSPQHVTYVWFDALINYISAVGKFDAAGKYSSCWWPASVHLIGKDILRQHAVYWPVILKALEIEMPKAVFAHGWWMIGENKMSKSRGNTVSPLDIADKYGIDAYRYFLLKDVPFGQDGSFSEESIIKRYNSDLANDLGNLTHRSLTMVEKYFNGNVPEKSAAAKPQEAVTIDNKIRELNARLLAALSVGEDYNFSSALEAIWEIINCANKYVEQAKPWVLAKEGKSDELKDFILTLVCVLRATASAIRPFMPKTAERIEEQVKEDKIKKAKPLFPRIDYLTTDN